MGISLRQGVVMHKRKAEAKRKRQPKGKNKKGKKRRKASSPSAPASSPSAPASSPSAPASPPPAPAPASPPPPPAPALPTRAPTPIRRPTPPPSKLLSDLPMPYSEFPLHKRISDRFPELGIDCIPTVIFLMADGTITDPDKLLRDDKSGKVSWDTGRRSVIPLEGLMCSICTFPDPNINETAQDVVQRYLDSARASEYFDADPMARPKEIREGLYVLYPGGLEDQRDPIFEIGDKLMNYQSNIEKLAMAAVAYHNYLTDAGITFSAVKKANLFFHTWLQTYFITLEVLDSKGETLTCRSRIECYADPGDDFPFHGKSVIEDSFVESFKFVD